MENHQKRERPFRRREKQQPTAQQADDYISPLDFLDMETEEDQVLEAEAAEQKTGGGRHHGLFVVGTDVGVGKTVAICALASLLKERQVDVGVMKPIDCGTDDVRMFREELDIGVVFSAGNVYTFKEKITPYFAFRKNHTAFDLQKTAETCRQVIQDHEVTLIEGPGGLCDPLSDTQTVTDLIKEIGTRVVIVAPLKRGTMNHLMLLAGHARACGVKIQGVLLTETERSRPKAYFLAKIQAVRELAGLPVLGIIPFLEKGGKDEVLAACHKKVSFKLLLDFPKDNAESPAPQTEAAVSGHGDRSNGGAEQKAKRPFSRPRRRRRAVRPSE